MAVIDCVLHESLRVERGIRVQITGRYEDMLYLFIDAEARGGPKALRPKGMVATARKVALLGAGPASLACAAYLALEGHRPVIFEKRELPGGPDDGAARADAHAGLVVDGEQAQ